MLLFASAVAVVLVVSFLCSVFEAVLLSINPAQVAALKQRGRAAGRLLDHYKHNIDRPIAAILILNTAAHTIGASVAGASFSRVFSDDKLWLFTLLFTTAVLLLTEIIPKTLGVSYTTRLAVPVARGIQFLTLALRPLVFMSERLSGALRGKHDRPSTSVEEIRLLAALGRNEGIVGPGAAGIILGATRLRQITAADVMIPRQQVSFLSRADTRAQTVQKLRTLRFSRFPVSDSHELDQVSGMVLARELLFWLQEHPDGDIDWNALTIDGEVVPDSKPLNFLLRMFQVSRRHMATVVDEYGSVRGIVTLEDVLEELVGEIIDESDPPQDDITRAADGSLEVRATVDLRRVCAELGIDWKPDSGFTSVGGLLAADLGRIPAVGDTVDWRGHRIEVLSLARRRADRVRIARYQEPGR